MFALVQNNRWISVSEKSGTMFVLDRKSDGSRYNGYEYLIYVG